MGYKYRITNNTDLRGRPFLTNNRRAADRIWRQVQPGQHAGNLYAASFQMRCPTCGEWQDATTDYATCACER